MPWGVQGLIEEDLFQAISVRITIFFGLTTFGLSTSDCISVKKWAKSAKKCLISKKNLTYGIFFPSNMAEKPLSGFMDQRIY